MKTRTIKKRAAVKWRIQRRDAKRRRGSHLYFQLPPLEIISFAEIHLRAHNEMVEHLQKLHCDLINKLLLPPGLTITFGSPMRPNL